MVLVSLEPRPRFERKGGVDFVVSVFCKSVFGRL
jgi:hypothetical protein